MRCQAQGHQCVLFTIFFLTSFRGNLFSTSTSNLILLDCLVFLFLIICVVLFEYKLKDIEAFLRTPVSLGTLIEHQSNERQRWNGSDLSLLLIGTRSKLRAANFVCLRTLFQQQITNMDPAKEQETMHGLTSTCHTETFITSIDKINQTCIII